MEIHICLIVNEALLFEDVCIKLLNFFLCSSSVSANITTSFRYTKSSVPINPVKVISINL